MLSLDEFVQQSEQFDAAVENTPDIAKFCSGMDWGLAAHSALHLPRELYARCEDGHWLALTRGPLSSFSHVFQPLEFAWGFGCPLVGPVVRKRIDMLLEFLDVMAGEWELTLVGGVPQYSPLWFALNDALDGLYYFEMFEGTHCIQSNLLEGAEAFLANRKPRFRSNIRRSGRLAQREGVVFEWVTSPIDGDHVLARAMAIEERSWKFQTHKSIFLIPKYKVFYRHLALSLSGKGTFRALFAKDANGTDIAYVMGGVLGGVYRGFQLSYDQDYSKMGLGHLVQWEMIKRLADEGVTLYDLGMAMDYKQRWADDTLSLMNFAIFAG